MATPIEMPKLGNTVEDCLLARWNKLAGDSVAEGELLAEIETDKATFDLTSPVAGTLLATFYKDGDLVPVYTNVCVVGSPGESTEPFKPSAAAPPAPPPSAPSASTPAPSPAVTEPRPSGSGAFSPRARRFAAEHNFHPDHITGSGPQGRVLESDLRSLYYSSPRPTPLAQRMIDEGFELRTEAPGVARASDLGPAPEKMSTVRERTARRLRESLAVTAQYTMNSSADATGLLALRARIKSRAQSQALPDININELVMFCAVKALVLTPEVNVEFSNGRIYRHSDINIGFACDTPRGLLVPVVKQAQKMTLPELALCIKDLTRQALDGSISPDDFAGGTFTVSNLGIYGIESFSPILNPPQVAILGVNSIELKPIRRGGEIVFVDRIGLSLTCDHQVIDGAPGARFLKTCREQIEKIESIAGLEF